VPRPATASALPRTNGLDGSAEGGERPSAAAFIDLSDRSQIGDGSARCVGVALCNEAGDPCNSFRQGDVAVFYYEFEVTRYIGVPICGLVIQNERGTLVHGKNSWQFKNDVAVTTNAGSTILCKYEIKLDIGPGEYVFEIGLASVSEEAWAARNTMSHEEMSARHIRNCHIANAGSFSVGLAMIDGVAKLTHHGIANLAGDMSVTVEQSQPLSAQSAGH